MSLKIVGGGVQRIDDGKGRLTVDRGIMNVIEKTDYQHSTLNTLGDIADVLGQTLGPFGNNVLLTEPYGATPVFPSKDGFRIMLNIKYDNPIYDTIYRICRDISSRMNQKVGDSTTTGNVIAYHFYKAMLDYMNSDRVSAKKLTPAGIRNILKVSEQVLADILRKDYVQTVSDETSAYTDEIKTAIYKKVATVAANNDPEIGEIVSELFAKTGGAEAFIDVERADGDKTYVDGDMGFEMPMGILHRSMVTEVDGQTCKMNNPFFLLIDGPLTTNDLHSFARWAMYVGLDLQKPIVVVAGAFTQDVLNWIISARAGIEKDGHTVSLPIAAIMVDSNSDMGNNRLKDLEVALGAISLPTKDGVIVDANKMADAKLIQYLGRAETFKSQMFHSRIIGCKGNPETIKIRIDELQKEVELKTLSDNVQFQVHIAMLKKRIAMMRGHMSTIYVGGDTYKEKESQRLLVEDAVCAVRSTIENGFTLGGNVSISHLIENRLDEIVTKIVDTIVEKKLNVCVGNKRDAIEEGVRAIIEIVRTTFPTAYRKVLEHAGFSDEEIDATINSCIKGDGAMTHNLMTGNFEQLGVEADLIVAGNTDTEIIGSVFAVALTFLTSNRLMTMYHPGVNAR